MSQRPRSGISISYVDEDKAWQDRFETKLAATARRGFSQVWADERVDSGEGGSR